MSDRDIDHLRKSLLEQLRPETPSALLPTDRYSLALRSARAHPGAFSASSTIHESDDYGNARTWVIDTYRLDGGQDLVFLQWNSAAGGDRLVLPAAVSSVLARHRDQLASRVRRRGAHKAIATKLSKGVTLGNPAALAKARKARQRKGK